MSGVLMQAPSNCFHCQHQNAKEFTRSRIGMSHIYRSQEEICHVQEAIFETDSVRVQSKHHDLIAFSLDLALLSRVLRAAGANDADLLEVKLAMCNVASGPNGAMQSRPFLTFTSRGANMNMVQDLPISKPYPAEGPFLQYCPRGLL